MLNILCLILFRPSRQRRPEKNRPNFKIYGLSVICGAHHFRESQSSPF